LVVRSRHREAISAKGDPLEALKALIPFESFRADIEAVVRLAPEERKSNAGRRPFDAVMMFKVLVLQALYNLADKQVEYQIRDRLSFMRTPLGPWPRTSARWRQSCAARQAARAASTSPRTASRADVNRCGCARKAPRLTFPLASG
jgi:hypothetical protein